MYIVEILSLTTKTHKDVLSYYSKEPIPVGTIIEAPFRKGTIHGLVQTVRPLAEQKSKIKSADFQLRKLTHPRTLGAIDPHYLETIRETAESEYIPARILFDRLIPDSVFSLPVSKNATPYITTTRGYQHVLIQATREHRASHYRAEIRAAFARGESVCLVAPTQTGAMLWYEILARGIEHYTVMLTGALTAKEQLVRMEQLIKGVSSHPFLLITTPLFASLMPHTTTQLILEHEHEHFWYGAVTPFVDLRAFFGRYAQKRGLTLSVGDTFLRVETSGKRFDDKTIEARELNWQYMHTCRIEIVPRNEEPKMTRTSRALSETTLAHIREALTQNKNVFIYTLRNGLSAITFCSDCGHSLACDFCKTPLSLFENGKARYFVCHRCHQHTPSKTICPNCRSWNLTPYALGTEKIYEEILEHFPEEKILLIDRTHVTGDKTTEKAIASFEKNSGKILIGTPRVVPYFKTGVDLVVIPSLDTLVARSSYSTEEDILALLLHLESNTKERMVIQTKNEADILIDTFLRGNYTNWYRQTLIERKALSYPPYGTVIKISALIPDTDITEKVQFLEQLLASYHPDIVTSASRDEVGQTRMIVLLKIPESVVDPNLHIILTELAHTYRVTRNPLTLIDY